MDNIHFIYNPVAGRGYSQKVWQELQQFINSIAINYTVHETKYEQHAKLICQELTKKKKPVTIIVLGGDGTLSEVINGIENFDTCKISLIASGSGNDFIRSTKLNGLSTIEAFKYIYSNKPRKIDFININDTYRCINVCGFGLDTDILNTYYKMHGFSQRTKYKLATVYRSLFHRWHATEIKINGKEGVWHKTLLISVGNGTTLGGGLNICPKASIDDGWLDITSIGYFPWLKTVPYLSKVMKGEVLSLPCTSCQKAKEIVISLPNKTFQYDGQIVYGVPSIKISIDRNKINFIG